MTDYATLLRDHITLTCRSVDRIFLQGYVPKLQSVGWVCQFRHLVAPRDRRASGPGLRPVDLFGVSVFRAGPRRPGTQRVLLRLLGVPTRVQPQPAVRLWPADGPGVHHGGGPDPLPA